MFNYCEGVLKVIRRSRATLIVLMGVPMVKPQWIPEVRFPPVRHTILEVRTPSPSMFMRIIVRRCHVNIRGSCRLLEDLEQL